MPTQLLASPEIPTLRDRFYNATVAQRIDVTAGLMIVRIRPDQKYPAFEPGQYTTIGLGEWEPRMDGVAGDWHPQSATRRHPPIVRRAFSISCPILTARGNLACVDSLPWLEFYVALVSRASDHPPMLSPRLFALSEGSRLYLGAHAYGRYTLAGVKATENVAFFATGTGEAPHNAMIAQLLQQEHAGRIVSVICARHFAELGYLAQHRELEHRFPNYRCIALTTREPHNLDPSVPGYVGKQHVQDLVTSGRLERELGYSLDPANTHVFLCGNPAMLGIPHKSPDGQLVFPEPPGMIEIFTHRGFQCDRRGWPNIHFERYW
jgi:ferredoxin--NADP+ reductase